MSRFFALKCSCFKVAIVMIFTDPLQVKSNLLLEDMLTVLANYFSLFPFNVSIISSNSRFKIDQNYIGEPPSLEVTIFHLNDNIDKQFLSDMVQKFGHVEELFIYYHPLNSKHLGIGRVIFEDVKSAKHCVDKLNKTSVMGKLLEVFLDPFGEKVCHTELIIT